jgi:hypothetical protein
MSSDISVVKNNVSGHITVDLQNKLELAVSVSMNLLNINEHLLAKFSPVKYRGETYHYSQFPALQFLHLIR